VLTNLQTHVTTLIVFRVLDENNGRNTKAIVGLSLLDPGPIFIRNPNNRILLRPRQNKSIFIAEITMHIVSAKPPNYFYCPSFVENMSTG